jgi:hypothetical protein
MDDRGLWRNGDGFMLLTSEGVQLRRCMGRPMGDKGGTSSMITHIGLVCGGSCIARDIIDE